MKDYLEKIHNSSERVNLVWITPGAEEIMSFCARVSSPQNQLDFDTSTKLLKYCIKNGHWSVFEQANFCVQIVTGRDISPQILRHKSFCFQEFSQRYAKASSFQKRSARRQDTKNRQNSIDNLPSDINIWFDNAQEENWNNSFALYEKALTNGVAKECARALLPLNTTTKLYMNGTIRSWIHYLQLRCGNGTQLEHQEIANDIKKLFIEALPNISAALDWKLEDGGE